jgi:hypothetical protein
MEINENGYPLCSIIVLNYNGKNYLKKCLDSLKKLTYPNYEIIFVDNASTDDSIEFVEKNYTEIKIIKNESNLGFAEGNNVGIRNSNGEYIILFNNDVIVDKNWLNETVKIAKSDKKIGIVGGKIYDYDSNVLQHAGGRLHKFTNFYLFTSEIGAGEKDVRQYDKIREVDYVICTAILIKKNVIEKIGLMDNGFYPLYGEDIDLNYRVRKMGYRIVYTPSAKVWHIGSGTFGKIPREKKYYIQKNKIRFVLKDYEFYLILWFIFSQTIHIIFKLFEGIIKKTFRDDLYAIYHGIEWNMKNIQKTLGARKEWHKIKNEVVKKFI